jgi:hypothetical protein
MEDNNLLFNVQVHPIILWTMIFVFNVHRPCLNLGALDI